MASSPPMSIWSSDDEEEDIDIEFSRLEAEDLLNQKFILLRMKRRFLEVVLLSFEGREQNNSNGGHLKTLLFHIRTVLQDTEEGFERHAMDLKKFSSVRRVSFLFPDVQQQEEMDDLLSSMLDRLEILNRDVQQVYEIVSFKSTSSLTTGRFIMIHEDTMENLNSLLEIVEEMIKWEADLASTIKDELEATQKRLRYLRNFFPFTAKRCSESRELKDLGNHTEFLVRKMSCLFYLCCSVNDGMVKEIKMHLSFELHKFSPVEPEVREIYIKGLKASKSARVNYPLLMVDEFDLGFLDCLRDAILELAYTNEEQLLSLHEEVRLLATSFAMYKISEEQTSNLDELSNHFMEHISNVIIDMACLIYSFHNADDDDKAKDSSVSISDLQESIMIAKEEVRKAYDACIPNSWLLKTKFQTSNALGIRTLMRNLEKISYHTSHLELFIIQAIDHGFGPHLSRHLAEVLRQEIKSIISAFSDFTSKPQLQIDICLSDIRNRTENLISSFLQGSRSLKSLSFILFEEINRIKKELESHRNKMMHGTSNYAEIFEDEADQSGKQLINESQETHSLPINAGVPGIDDHESNLDSICPLKDEANTTRLKASFLKVLQRCKGMWHIEHESLEVLLNRMSSGIQSADEDLQRLLSNLKVQISIKKCCSLPMNMDCLPSSVLSRFLKPAIQEGLTMDSNSSRFITGASDEAMENLNTLLQNIDVLLECNAELVVPLNKEFEGVQNRLRFVRNFIGFTAKRCSKHQILKDLQIHAESLAGNISCLLYLCCCYNERMNDELVNLMKMHFSSVLQMFNPAQADVRETYIKALKASKSEHKFSIMLSEFDLAFIDSLQDNILELSETSLRFITFNKDQILSLQEQLKFLITFFEMDRPLEEYPEYPISNFFEAIDAVIIDTGYVIYSLNNGKKDEKFARELNEKVSDLVASIMSVKEVARDLYDLCVPKSLQSDFPRTNAQGFISSLVGKLKELLNSKSDVVAPLEHHIVIVQKELLSLREDFSKIAKQGTHFKELQRQWIFFLDIAYITEYVIDSFLAKDGPLYCHKLGLFNVIEDIKRIKTELKAIKIKTRDEPSVDKPSCFSIQVSVESSFPKDNVALTSKEILADEKSMTKLVVFSEEAEKIRVQLTNGSRKLNIISIVGMPGIGKTTLADSVFQDSSLTNHFHVQARCSVSQVHDKWRLLLEVLQQVATGSTQYGNDDLDQRLYKSLKGRRYLILMDDVWNIQPWKDIKDSFPDDEIGSRIILTSRFQDITTQVGLESINFRLSPLSEEKSWEMLKVKLFGNKCCPSELVSLGREIAISCKGLPLTVDLVAGILREKEIKEWKKVAESLMTLVFEDPEGRCQKVLELSYQNLPDNLKPCFLYFASFPEDANVPTRDLILLWIAEGFIQLEEGELRSLEDVAEDILKNLFSRSLVTISRRRPLGGVAASRVHDLLHEFAAAKAQEESFMLKIDAQSKFSTLSTVDVHDQWQKQYRLSIYPDSWGQFVESNPSGPRTRALISSAASPLGDYFSLNFRAFKVLRVLYIPKVRTYFSQEMLTLIHLRLLAIDTFANSVEIMSKIHELPNLESFVMVGALSSKVNVHLLLDKICNMVRLRHFCFGGYISFKYCSEKIWELSSPFDNLRTLYNLRASYDEDIEKILKLMPNLVELKVLFYGPDEEIYPFPKFDFLKKLESLEVTHQGKSHFPPCRFLDINFPPYLKKLVLSTFQMPWTEVSIIGSLEYLEILELKNGAFMGPKWDMIDGEFPKLKYLSLYNLEIEEWNASEDHLSCLEQLCVATCRNLEDLPCCLAEMATLQVIRLFNCSLSVENSAKRIKEEQKESGNEEFLIEIY